MSSAPTATSRLSLDVRWVRPGPPDAPTALAFTGFGHRLDPWMRLRPPGWRVGVAGFPVGSAPTAVWEPADLAAQLAAHWRGAPRRALLAFSFGAAGATAVAGVLADADPALRPQFAAYVAPVQWARAPWGVLRAVPRGARLRALRGIASGSNRLLPVVGRLAGPSVNQFVGIVERYVGWDFVAQYLPYLDWIDPTARTLAAWQSHPWPALLVGGSADRVIPHAGMARQAAGLSNVAYAEVASTHFDALDRARPRLLERLAALPG